MKVQRMIKKANTPSSKFTKNNSVWYPNSPMFSVYGTSSGAFGSSESDYESLIHWTMSSFKGMTSKCDARSMLKTM